VARRFRHGLAGAGPFGCRCLIILAVLRFHSRLVEPDGRISRIGLSDGLHRPAHGHARRRALHRPHSSFRDRKPYVGCADLAVNPRPLVTSIACPKSGPFPPPALLGFTGTTSLSATPRQPGLSLAGVRLARKLSPLLGLPVLRRSPCTNMPSPLPRWDRRRVQVAPLLPATAAFPNPLIGRLPH
jgi:hypothetical protein